MSKLTDMIKDAIEHSNLTQRVIGDSMGIAPNFISNWKKLGNIPLNRIDQFAKLCRIEANQLYREVLKVHHPRVWEEVEKGNLHIHIK